MPKSLSDIRQSDTPRTRARNRERKKQKFLKHLEIVKGIVSVAAMRARVHRSTVYAWRAEDPEFAEDMREIQEEFSVDWAESKLGELIDGVCVIGVDGIVRQMPPDIRALTFFLNARGRNRGYGIANLLPSVAKKTPAPQDCIFVGTDGFSITGAEFLAALEAVATLEELKTLHNVMIRARQYLKARQDVARMSSAVP